MHNPFLENPSQLRKEWKALRQTLTAELTDMQHLERVVSWWSPCPISRQWLDWDDPSKWPDPWELITSKDLDYSAIALGMEYTLLLSSDGRWSPDRIRLCLVSDVGKTFQHLAVEVDGCRLLNVEHARIADMDDDYVIHARYCYDTKRHINLMGNAC